MRLKAVGGPPRGLEALEQELLQLSAAKGRAATPRRLTLNMKPVRARRASASARVRTHARGCTTDPAGGRGQGMSVTLRSPRGMLHLYSPSTGPGSPGDYVAGGLLTERLRLLEESISDETEMHRKLEVLGALAVRVNAASMTPSPEGAGDTAQRTSVMPVRSPTPSNGSSSQKLGLSPPCLRAHCAHSCALALCTWLTHLHYALLADVLAASMSPLPPRSSRR
jgi:hypothetical protein